MPLQNATELYSDLFADVPHPQGTCHGLRMFVYDLPRALVADTLRDVARAVKPGCLLGRCDHTFTNALFSYTGELFILRRLLSQCSRVDRPEAADFFLVPFPLSLWRVVGWSGRRSVRNIQDALTPHIVHMNARTSRRHVFLDTNDAVFLMSFASLPHFERAIVVHLGPDFWSGYIRDASTVVRKQEFRRSIVVPHRTHITTAEGDAPVRDVSVFGALNTKRHPVRSALIRHFSAPEKNNRSVHVEPMSQFSGYSETDAWMRRSQFCLAPAGDTPSFTQRFPAAVLCGCVPVYVDPYNRTGASADRAPVHRATLPLHRTTDWRRAAVRVNAVDGLPATLLPTAERAWHVPQALRRRMQYDLRRTDDASQGALDELKILLGPLGSGAHHAN